MARESLRIVTRKSPLAQRQTRLVQDALQLYYPELKTEVITVVTQGDRKLQHPLANIGGKGLFTKELEEHLLDGKADLAVHSMKDMPAVIHSGLPITAIMLREDPRDAFVSTRYADLMALPDRARIGTSSLRRQSQLLAYNPTWSISALRGNVNSRLQKLEQGQFDAIVLAVAGLKRLNMEAQITHPISINHCLPAVGQGAIGLQCCASDLELQKLLAPLNDTETECALRAERTVSRLLGGSCQVPLAVYAERQGASLYMQALVAKPLGHQVVRANASGPWNQPEALGETVSEDLLKQGAGKIIAALADH